MFKTALNKNIIPHTWRLANIVPIPKPNKDTDKGTSYRPISLLSVIAKTLEKSLLPYITANTPMQHGYKTQHSTVTALHTLNNTVAKGFNQMAPPARTITVALDISKAFDTINIHTLIRKLLQTNISGTIIKFIANYIKGRKAYTTYRNHISRQFITGVPQGGVLSPTLFNIYTSDLPPPSAPVQVMAYADNIFDGERLRKIHRNASTVCARGTLAARHKKEVEVIHRRHSMCLWKSIRKHGIHVTVLPTSTSLLFG